MGPRAQGNRWSAFKRIYYWDGQPYCVRALAVAAMLVFYALEERSAVFVLAFAGASLAASVYGFLQGAWPFGVVELVWSGVALRRWWRRRNR